MNNDKFSANNMFIIQILVMELIFCNILMLFGLEDSFVLQDKY